MLFGTEAAEFWILNLIQDVLGCKILEFLISKITLLGNSGIIWIVIGLVLLCTKKYRRGGVFLLIGLLLGLIFGNVLLKNLIARPRPCWIYDVPMLIPNPTDFSFPSGHTLSSFISAFVLARINRKFAPWAFLLAGIMAFSRMYLFAHFPTDILGGIALAYVIYLMIRKFVTKQTDINCEVNGNGTR